ncbi:MAG TPA: hypothetical protein VF210_13780 [Pseudomonadales bacterium]
MPRDIADIHAQASVALRLAAVGRRMVEGRFPRRLGPAAIDEHRRNQMKRRPSYDLGLVGALFDPHVGPG